MRGLSVEKIDRGLIAMANTPKWNIRLRHEWLATPLKKKHLKRCQKARIGMLDAEARNAAKEKKAKGADAPKD